MTRVGYFEFKDGVGTFEFTAPVRGRTLFEAIRRVAEGLFFRGGVSYDTDYWTRHNVRVSCKFMEIAVEASTALGSGAFDIRDTYTGIEVSATRTDIEECSYVLCAFCYEVGLLVGAVPPRGSLFARPH